MPTVQVDDIQIFYRLLGEGFPLLMVHGASDVSDNWDPILIRGLSKRYKLIVFDVPGHGRSELSSKELSIKLFADETSGLMDALGISKAYVLGISLGGFIVQELVLSHPEKVRKLILVATHCGGSKRIPLLMKATPKLNVNIANLSLEDIVRTSVRFLFTEEFIKNNPEYVENHIQRRLSAPAMKKGFAGQRMAKMKFSTYERLSTINVPTLILQGKKDIMVAPENAPVLAEAIPNAKLVFFDNSAHYLAEEADKVLECILNFLG